MYSITWLLICDHWFHTRHEMAILRQKKGHFGEIEKLEKI